MFGPQPLMICHATDLKPENVMIFRDDLTDDIEVELIDYGVAQSLHGIVGGDQYLKTPHHFGTKGTLRILHHLSTSNR